MRLQLKEIEVNKLVEAEKREEECKIMNKLIASLHKQEEEEEQNRREKQIKMRDAYTKSFNENLHHKRVQEEELRISDMRVSHWWDNIELFIVCSFVICRLPSSWGRKMKGKKL